MCSMRLCVEPVNMPLALLPAALQGSRQSNCNQVLSLFRDTPEQNSTSGPLGQERGLAKRSLTMAGRGPVLPTPGGKGGTQKSLIKKLTCEYLSITNAVKVFPH